MDQFYTFGPLLLLIVIMYFLLIRPQRKREKSVNEMRKGLQVGDEIITIGGICGKIVKTKDETIIIQVGADKVKFEMMRWSVSKVVEGGPKAAPKVAEEPEAVVEEQPKKALPKRMKKTEPSDKDAE
jgi:preprotein translocase subunit YajC